MSSPRTYYALRNVGIFEAWADLEEEIKGMPSPVFKSFRTYSAAEAFLADATFASGDLVNPFGFAGPVTVAPTPLDKLGRPIKETKPPRKFHRPAASLSNPSSSHSASSSGRSRSHSIPSPAVAGPSSSSAGPSSPSGIPSASSAPSVRKRSPLIQSVVEEEEERDDVTPPHSSDGHSTINSRSRAGSVSSSAPSCKAKKSFGLSIFALSSSSSSSSSTPSNPPALASVSSFSSAESHGGPRTPPASPDLIAPKRFSIRRQSSASSVASSPSSPSPSSYSSPPNVKQPAATAHSLWGDAYMDLPKPLPLHPTPNTSAESVPFDPTSPFTYEAPVFSRRASASSTSSRNSIVLPLRSPSSSNPPSLKRQQSNLSLRSTTSIGSTTSDFGGPLRPPRMSRFGSGWSSQGSSPAGSFESLPEEARKMSRPVMPPASASAPVVQTTSLAQGWEVVERDALAGMLAKEQPPVVKEKKAAKAGGWKGKMKKLFGAA